MRIAYIADANCGHGFKWINHFSQSNEVILICTEGSEELSLYRDHPNIKVYHVLPAAYPLRKFWVRQKVVNQLKSIMSSHNIEIIHSMYAVPSSFWAYHTGHPNHIITTRGSDMLVDYNQTYRNPKNINEKFIYNKLAILVEESLNNARYITSTSIRQQHVIKQFINDPGKLVLTRTGVDSDSFMEGYNTLPKQTSDVVILSNRALSPLYNIHIIIEAFRMLKQQNPDPRIKLAIINFNTQQSYLEKVTDLIREYKLDKEVTLLEPQTGPGLLQIYKNADVVVMVPSSDGTPVSGIEVMLARKPLIMGSLHYDEDIFNNDTVWKINSLDPGELCNKMLSLISMPEEEKKSKTEKAFTAAITHANLTTEINRIEQLYRQMIEGTGKKIFHATSLCTCTNCILDTTDDPAMTFDANGICSYCQGYDQLMLKEKAQGNKAQLEKLLVTIKEDGKGKEYDCVLGISGGVDSSYLAYQAKQLGLRPLVVHYDNGWNSEIAVRNIENITQKLGFDLYTYVNDWEEFKDLQLSFFKASVLDIEMLTDQAIIALMYKIARKYKLKYILSGSNSATEAILPSNWHHWKTDVLNIESIHRKFGKVKLDTYPRLGLFSKMYADRVLKIKSVPLLDYIPYIKEEAKKTISEQLNWKDYGGKHHESIFTRFYQSYYLPEKFGIDKRKAHLSTLICSGQVTREEALNELSKPLYENETRKREDIEYVMKKFGLSPEEFSAIMKMPPRSHFDYASYLTHHYRYFGYLGGLKRMLLGKKGNKNR